MNETFHHLVTTNNILIFFYPHSFPRVEKNESQIFVVSSFAYYIRLSHLRNLIQTLTLADSAAVIEWIENRSKSSRESSPNGSIDWGALKLTIFFHSLLSQVYVCPSLANLYEGIGKNDWRLKYTGVPVLLHDKGSARSRAVPRVTYILAERGSCFALWQDRIDNLSDYRVAGPAFHTMCLSTGKCTLVLSQRLHSIISIFNWRFLHP